MSCDSFKSAVDTVAKKHVEDDIEWLIALPAANPDYVEDVSHHTPYEQFAGLTIDGKVLP